MTFAELLKVLQNEFSGIHYAEAEHFHWSPYEKTVFYTTASLHSNEVQDSWTLLHETAHGLLGHVDFRSDFHLISLESEAWRKTSELSVYYGINPPDADYVEDCIDTYRNWQYRRSLCPECDAGGMQTNQDTYYCILCLSTWNVTKQRFCRAYRKNKAALA